MRKLPKLLLIALVANAAGCANVQLRDRRDAPWDPRGHSQLMDQIPGWDDAADRLCGGQLSEAERRRSGKSERC